MSSSASTASSFADSLFPLKVIDCSQTVSSKAGNDARVDYHCASGSAVLWPITITHLIIMVSVFLLATILYAILLRVRDRQANAQRRQLPVVSVQATVARSGKGGGRNLIIDAAASARLATSWQRYGG